MDRIELVGCLTPSSDRRTRGRAFAIVSVALLAAPLGVFLEEQPAAVVLSEPPPRARSELVSAAAEAPTDGNEAQVVSVHPSPTFPNTAPTSPVAHGYDGHRRVTAINIANGLRSWTYKWYKNGDLKKDGTETHNYDNIGRLKDTTGSSQWSALSWTYDEAGNRKTSNDAGCAVTYTYPTNDNGQASLTAVPGCIPGVTLAVAWTHDLNGRTTQGDETQNGAPTNIYQEIYNSAGRLTQDKKYSYAT